MHILASSLQYHTGNCTNPPPSVPFELLPLCREGFMLQLLCYHRCISSAELSRTGTIIVGTYFGFTVWFQFVPYSISSALRHVALRRPGGFCMELRY
ncbi:hypothetical protein GDO81_010690 [Engystomops pustulosus]|uniref:Uncharacterized protein n=1 Tax=Engystomops pustulosus TaxID=76066 RepID=A0AAV7C2W4_ENGPU|nr:hypothetical protein GDO81_010690 [Engystomops pustulosus]